MKFSSKTMSVRKLKAPDATQTTISHVFSAAAAKKTAPVAPKAEPKVEKVLSSDNPRIQAFYDSLTPKEVIAHSIAVEKLGTSYDVSRTHGFLKWSKTNPA